MEKISLPKLLKKFPFLKRDVIIKYLRDGSVINAEPNSLKTKYLYLEDIIDVFKFDPSIDFSQYVIQQYIKEI